MLYAGSKTMNGLPIMYEFAVPGDAGQGVSVFAKVPVPPLLPLVKQALDLLG